MPFEFPSFVLNAATVAAFNEAYYRSHPDGRRIVDFDSFFYPLDRVLRWNRIYGRRGFLQFQVLFPPKTSYQALTCLLNRIASDRQASFLAVLKSMGPAGSGWLSFPLEGHTLALDLPHRGAGHGTDHPATRRIGIEHEGRLYLAKDATMSPQVFQATYPNLPRFRDLKARLDPQNRFSSSLARRLGIVSPAWHNGDTRSRPPESGVLNRIIWRI